MHLKLTFEARIYAENPRNNFLPDSGSLHFLSTPSPTHTLAPSFAHLPSGTHSNLRPVHHTDLALSPSLRLEEGFTQGSQIGVYYDPMIATLVVHGRDRIEALRILRKALDDDGKLG
jgi:3-methylcrotonyl-CoA carboxylase alpha subunit